MKSPIPLAARAIKDILIDIRDSYSLAARTFVAGPLLVTFVALPEFAQHVVEITMGMFDNRQAAHSVGNSALRWEFGYVKLAGLLLSILFTARFWARGASLRTALIMTILVVAVFVPGQALHVLNHKWATGQARGLVWALMVFDALVVGLMAAAAGSALYVAQRRLLTWRGWA